MEDRWKNIFKRDEDEITGISIRALFSCLILCLSVSVAIKNH